MGLKLSLWSLRLRSETAAIGLALGLLDGKGYDEVQDHAPVLIKPLKLVKNRTRQNVNAGTQLKPKAKSLLPGFLQVRLSRFHPQNMVPESGLPQSL